MNVRDLITCLLEHPMEAPVFIDLNDDVHRDNRQAISHVIGHTNFENKPFVVIDADWGRKGG